MADYRGIEASTDALLFLLRANYDPVDFDGNELLFESYVAGDFEQPMANGVSLFLYRVTTNGSRRAPKGRVDASGDRFRTQLPVNLHYLVTVWAQHASLQQRIAGWLMRLLEDTPILPFGLLQAASPGVFNADETLEILQGDLGMEDLLHQWEAVIEDGYQLTLPYMVRNLYIESRQLVVEGEPVDTRTFKMRAP